MYICKMAEELLGTVQVFSKKTEDDQLITINWYKPSLQSKGVLFTTGLRFQSQHDLANRVDHIYDQIELYFLLPSHWDVSKINQKWPVEVLQRLITARLSHKVWYGPGDTLTAHAKTKNSLEKSLPINKLFQQNYFMLTEPIAATDLLENIPKHDCDWLGIMPIFQKEFEYKSSRSSLELMMNFQTKRVTEEVDEYRKVTVKKKFFGLF